MDNLLLQSLQTGLKQEQEIFEAVDCEENISVHELRHAVADLQGCVFLINALGTCFRYHDATQELCSEKARIFKVMQAHKINIISVLESSLRERDCEIQLAELSVHETLDHLRNIIYRIDESLLSASSRYSAINAELCHMLSSMVTDLEKEMSSGGSFTDFGELVLLIGDFHIPHSVPDIPQVFKELLNTDKIRTVLCTGNLGSEEVFDRLKQITSNVCVVKGDMDHNIKSVELPDHHVVRIGQFKIGLIHGHQIIPRGDHESLAAMQRKLDVDILVSGCTHRNEIFQACSKFFVNPGSATGAPNSCLSPAGTPIPSFMLMAIQGPSAVVYVYEYVDGAAKVTLSEFTKSPDNSI